MRPVVSPNESDPPKTTNRFFVCGINEVDDQELVRFEFAGKQHQTDHMASAPNPDDDSETDVKEDCRRPSYAAQSNPRRRCGCLRCLAWIGSVLLVGTALPIMGIDPPRLRFEMEELLANWVFDDRLKSVEIGFGGDGLLSPDEIHRVVKHSHPSATIFATDAAYLTPTFDDIQTFLQQSTAQDYTYVAERHDCDDYAQILQGELRQYEYYLHNNRSWAFGQAFGPLKSDATQLHAFNMFIDPSNRLWLVEPQSSQISSVGEFEYAVDSMFF